MNLLPGSQRITASGIVGPTVDGVTHPKPIRLFCVSLVSGGTASVLSLLNGTSASGTQYVSITGTISTGTVVNFAGGLRFPDGLYASADGNISSATFVYDYEL
jgi:hypothetical protein